MTIRESAYATTATSGMTVSKIETNLQAINTDDMHRGPEGVYGILGKTTFERNIPAFVFPIVTNVYGQDTTYVDLRPYGTFDEMQMKFRMRNESGADTALLQGALSLAWRRGRQRNIQLMSHMPVQVFMSWISEGIAKKLNLDGRSQYIVSVLAGILYLRNFTDKEWDSEEQMLVTNLFTRTFKMGDHALNQTLVQQHAHISDVRDFCTSCYEATQSVSLKNLNASILFAVVGGGMWGPNASERLCVALEYPPAFIACLFQVITDQSYRGKCEISKIAQRSYLSKQSIEFVQGCLAYLDKTN